MGTEKKRIILLLSKYLERDDVRDIEGLSVDGIVCGKQQHAAFERRRPGRVYPRQAQAPLQPRRQQGRPHAHNCPRLLIRARRGRNAANVGVWRAQSGHPAHGALLSCIFSLVPCINRRGRPFPSQRTPAWTVQKPEYSASRPPPATPRTGSIARPASLWGTARRETRAIATSYAVCRPKSPVEGSREIK